jgi:SAM-dependent methyltransferase
MPAKRTPSRDKEWFADESFWRDLVPFMFPEARFTSTPQQVERLLALTQPAGTAALDLCCGPGRCSIALAQQGYAVTGVDRSRFMLGEARRRARAARVKVEWVHMDMRDFVRPAAFDLALSMFTSFGYFADPRDDARVLANLLASLRPGGVCVIDVMGKERLARILQPTTSDVLPDGTMLVENHRIVDDWTRVENEWIMIRNDVATPYRFSHTVYSGAELRDLMRQAGFSPVRLYGNLEGDEYGPEAQRLVAVGRKPVSP